MHNAQAGVWHEVSGVLRDYLDAAMPRARYETLPDNGGYYGEIPGLDGLWANASGIKPR